MINRIMTGSLMVMLLIISGNTGLAEDKNKKNEIIVGFAKDTAESEISSFEKKVCF